MKNYSVQKKIGWCVIHCLANMLESSGFNHLFEEEKYKGCSSEDEDFALTSVFPDLGMADLCSINEFYGRLPKSMVWDIVSKKECFDYGVFEMEVVPYVLSIDSEKIKNGRHAILILNCDGVILVSNPWWNEMEVVSSAEELFKIITPVTVIRRPFSKEEGTWAILNGEKFNYYKSIKQLI